LDGLKIPSVYCFDNLHYEIEVIVVRYVKDSILFSEHKNCLNSKCIIKELNDENVV